MLDVQLIGLVEKRVKLVKLLLRNGVVLMVVALCAADGKAEPHGAEGARAVLRLQHAKLLNVRASLAIAQRVAQKAGGDAL